MYTVDAPLVRGAKRLLPSPAKRATGTVLRAYGTLTAPWRSLPDFLVIGAKRCGSTSLYSYVLQHPDVAPMFPAAEGKKGTHYFDRHSTRSMPWYRSHFPRSSSGRLCGEASTYYFSHPYSAQRAAATVPGAKLVALLREPGERAFSQYRDEVKNGNETLSFADALAREPERLEPELERMRADPHYYSFRHEHLSYLTWGRYAEHLERWLEVFPRDQLLVLRSEDLFAEPERVFRRVTDFLGLTPFAPPFRRYNEAPAGRLDPAARALLTTYYEPHNARLGELLGPTAPAW